jgi:hypothetical protein
MISKQEISAREAAKLQCSQWNETRQPVVENGTITYLVTRQFDLGQLSESLPRLRYFFLKYWPYPIKIFIVSDSLREYDNDTFNNMTCPHDFFDNATGTWKTWTRPRYHAAALPPCLGEVAPNREQVSKVVSAGLGEDYDWEIVTFDLRIPEAVQTDPGWEACQREHLDCGPRFINMNTCAKKASTGYKHMNQFFTKVMYENEAMSKYRYYLRLDADFEFRGQISRDPFCLMAKTGRKFVWQTRKRSRSLDCTDGIWEWFLKYQQDNGLTPQDHTFWRPEGAIVNYVGYAGMGDLDFFRSERVRKLADAFNKDGRVYLNRWSDQTYYVLLFALFENHSAVGDLGFTWSNYTWCHKCRKQGKFDPVTGEITPSVVLPKRKKKHPPGFSWKPKPGSTKEEHSRPPVPPNASPQPAPGAPSDAASAGGGTSPLRTRKKKKKKKKHAVH